MNEGKDFYEFDGLRFYPDERLLVRLDDGHPFGLTPKFNALLFALIKRRGGVVTYDEIKSEVWPESGQVHGHTVRETKRALSRLLANTSHRLETITGKSYRLNVSVSESGGEIEHASGGEHLPELIPTAAAGGDSNPADGTASPGPNPTPYSARRFGGHLWHALASCALYSLLYVIALLVEVAYAFDRLGASALRIAPLVFTWVYATSLLGLAVMSRRSS